MNTGTECAANSMNVEAKLRQILEVFGKRSAVAADSAERLSSKVSGPRPRPEQTKNSQEKRYPNDIHALVDDIHSFLSANFIRIEEALELAHNAVGSFAPEVSEKAYLDTPSDMRCLGAQIGRR